MQLRLRVDSVLNRSRAGGAGPIAGMGRAHRADCGSDSQAWPMLFQVDGWLSELEHVADGGADLRIVDPTAL